MKSMSSDGVVMFSSGLTKGIYNSFLRSYQLDRSELESTPFIYADLGTCEVKLLTSLLKTSQVGSEIFAVSIATHGQVEVLSTESE